MTLSHMREALRERLMAGLCTFRRPSMCRRVHRPCMRNALRDVPLLLLATACDQRHDVEAYCRSKCFKFIMRHRLRVGMLPQGLEVLMDILQQCGKGRPLVIMGDLPARPTPEPLDPVGIRIVSGGVDNP